MVRFAAIAGAALGVAIGVRVAAAGVVMITRIAGLWLAGARFGYRVATFRVWRRCPDCFAWIDRRARVCRHCGLQLPYKRS